MAEADTDYVRSLHAGDEALFLPNLSAAPTWRTSMPHWLILMTGPYLPIWVRMAARSASPVPPLRVICSSRILKCRRWSVRGNGYATQLMRAACSTCYDAWVRTVISLPAGQ